MVQNIQKPKLASLDHFIKKIWSPQFNRYQLIDDGIDVGLDEGQLWLILSVNFSFEKCKSGFQILERRASVGLEQKKTWKMWRVMLLCEKDLNNLMSHAIMWKRPK